MPSKDKLTEGKTLRLFNEWIHKAHVWHLNRRSATRAVMIGLFFAFVPLPIQMFLAIAACIYLRANLPLAIAFVWLTNPLTIPPVFYATYRLGTLLLNLPTHDFAFEMSWDWLLEKFAEVWEPLFLGSLVCGVAFAALGYTIVDLLWRHHTLKRWHNRHN